MTEIELKERIINILSVSDDPEAAHSMEDKLHRDIIAAFCPEWVVKDIEKLNNANFSRWCA